MAQALRYFFLSDLFHAQFMRTVAGVGGSLARAKASGASRILIPVPPLAEQKRIVWLLDEADAIRKLRAQADQRTADLIPAIFHEMFGDPVTNPMRWPVKPLSEVVAGLQGGKNVNPAAEGEPGGRYRVLKVSAVTSDTFAPEASKPVPVDYNPPASHFVRQGDVLFSRANTAELVGASCYVTDEHDDLLLPDKIWRLVWKQDSPVEPLYVLYLLHSKPIRRQLSRLASGTGGSMKNISQAKLVSLVIPIPPLSDHSVVQRWSPGFSPSENDKRMGRMPAKLCSKRRCWISSARLSPTTSRQSRIDARNTELPTIARL